MRTTRLHALLPIVAVAALAGPPHTAKASSADFTCSAKFEGESKDGYSDRSTVHLCRNGQYAGGLNNWLFDGHGRRTFANGAVIEGQFKRGNPKGSIRYYTSDGNVISGTVVLPARNPSVPEQKLKNPPLAVRLNHEGTVLVSFVVTKDGSVRDAQVLRASVFWELDAAALNYVNSLRLRPGTVAGMPVDLELVRLIEFKITADEKLSQKYDVQY